MITPNKGLTKHLIEVILSLNKAEKKRFALFLNGNKEKDHLQFVLLYRYIDKEKSFDEKVFLTTHKDIKKSQLSNLKRRLFSKLLQVLEKKEGEKDIDLQIREQIDASQTLFNKGLYEQSLWMLNKAKQKALTHQRHLLLLEIVNLEKNIELHFVTGRPSNIAIELTKKSNEQLKVVEVLNQLSGVALTFYGIYQEKGYVKNRNEFFELEKNFKNQIQHFVYYKLNIAQKIYFHQAHFWYYYNIQNFLMCFKYAKSWVQLLEESNLENSFQVQYFKGLNSLLNSLYRLNDIKRFKNEREKLQKLSLKSSGILNTNLMVMLKKYEITHSLNLHFMEGTFREGFEKIPQILQSIENLKPFLEPRFINSVYYKIASVYFGAEHYKKALVYLNKILFEQHTTLRQDINAFSRILATVCHFELKNEKQLAYSIRSTYHFIGSIKDLNKFQREIFRFLKKTFRMDRYETRKAFEKLYKNMIKISNEPFEQRPFYYFDIISWLESKFEKRPIADLIKERGLGHRKLFRRS